MEDDGVHEPGIHEQDRDRPGVNHRVPGHFFHPGMDPGVLLDEQPVPERAPLLEQVVDNIPGEIHQFVDRRLNRWSRHSSMVLPGPDSLVEPVGVSLSRLSPGTGVSFRRRLHRMSEIICTTGGTDVDSPIIITPFSYHLISQSLLQEN